MFSAAAVQLLGLTALAQTPRFGAMVPLLAANGDPTSGRLLQDVDGYHRARDCVMTALHGQHEVSANDWFLREQGDGFSGTHVPPHGTHVTGLRADLVHDRTRVNESMIQQGQLVEVSQEIAPKGNLVRNSVTNLFSPSFFRDPSLLRGVQGHRGLFYLVEALENIAMDFRSAYLVGPLKIRIDFFVAGKRHTQTIEIPLDELFLQYKFEFLDERGSLYDVAHLVFSPGSRGEGFFSVRPMQMTTIKIRVPAGYDFVKATGHEKNPYDGIKQTHFDLFFALAGAEYASVEPAFAPRSPHRTLIQGGDVFGMKERILAEPGSFHLPTTFTAYSLILDRLRGRP